MLELILWQSWAVVATAGLVCAVGTIALALFAPESVRQMQGAGRD